MTYGTLTNVKILCGIDAAETNFDVALTLFAPYASMPIVSLSFVVIDVG